MARSQGRAELENLLMPTAENIVILKPRNKESMVVNDKFPTLRVVTRRVTISPPAIACGSGRWRARQCQIKS